MTPFENPALSRFISEMGESIVFGPLLVRKTANGFELRHALEAGVDPNTLRTVDPESLQELASHAADGSFRPNKAAPNLKRGWTCTLQSQASLEAALEALLPGAVPDWYASLGPVVPLCNYREFAERQTGMYRNTASLSDPEACEVTRACCDARFCTRRRLWNVGSIGPDEPSSKSAAPCLEPCALLLELARKAHRISQEERSTLNLSESDLATLSAAFDLALATPDPSIREGDSSAAGNPRRIMLLREKLLPWLPREVPTAGH
jgi:hypothetical protein